MASAACPSPRRYRAATAAMAITLVLLLTGGCESAQKKDMGTLFGGLLGGFVGSQVADDKTTGLILGAVVGGLVGRMVGSYMDEQDRLQAAQALETSAVGETSRWENGRTGNRFELTPTTATYIEDGRECRDFEQVAIVDGERRSIAATACRRAAGESWEVV